MVDARNLRNDSEFNNLSANSGNYPRRYSDIDQIDH